MSRVLLLPATALATLLAAPVAAQPTTLLDLLSLDRLATIGAQWAITALRGVATVTYVDLDLQPLQGRMSLTGLQITPYAAPEGCTISLDRALIASAPLDQIDHGALTIDLVGVTVAPDCLEAEMQAQLAPFGLTALALDHGRLALDYTFATGALSADLRAVSGPLAEIHAWADFSYVAVNYDSEEPVIDFASAELELVDRGLMAGLAPMMPPGFADPEALSAMLEEVLLPTAGAETFDTPEPEAPMVEEPEGGKLGGGKQGGPLEPWTDEEEAPLVLEMDPDQAELRATIRDGAGVLAAFLAEPGRIVLRLEPPAPVRLSEEIFADFATFARALYPRLETGPRPDTGRVTGAQYAAIEASIAGDGAGLGEDDALRYARAFLTGIGAPRDPGLATRILSPLLEAGRPAAIALALDRLDLLEPATAYQMARLAAAGGDRRAFAHLDALERGLGTEAVLALQAVGTAAPALTGAETAHALYEQGFAAMTGIGTPRNYAQAYFYGLLALAGGDMAARAVVDEIEAMGGRFAPDAAAAWDAMLIANRTAASASWFAAR